MSLILVVDYKHNLWHDVGLQEIDSILHANYLLLQLINLSASLVFSLDCFLFFNNVFIFVEEAFCFVVDEVTENLEAVSLLDWLLFEELCDCGNS